MSWISERLDRLRQIVAEAVMNGIDGESVKFADFVLMKASCWGLAPNTSRTYIDTLMKAWNYNHWITYVQGNNYILEEKKEKWIQKHKRKSTTTLKLRQYGGE